MNVIVGKEKIQGVKNEQIDIFDDPLSDDVLKDLVEFAQSIREKYETVNDEDSERFLAEQAQIFGSRNHLGEHEISAVQEILHEDLMNFHHPKEIALPENDSKITAEDSERIKTLVKENLRSAALNYIRFVLPHENTDAYEEKARNFWEKEGNYIVEDLGYKNPYAEQEAIEELKRLLPAEVQYINTHPVVENTDQTTISEEKKERPMIERQKEAVRRAVKKYSDAYQSIDKDSVSAMDALMQQIRTDVEMTDDLHGQELDKVMEVFGKFMPFVLEKAREEKSKKEKTIDTPKNAEEQLDQNEHSSKKNEKEDDNEHIKKEVPTEEEIAVLKKDLDDARMIYAEKKVARDNAWRKIVGALGRVDAKNDDDINIIRAAYEKAYAAYRDAYVENFLALPKQEQRKKLIGSLDDEYREKMALYDAMTIAKAENVNKRISKITERLSEAYQKIPRYAKRAAVVTFLIAGMFFGGQRVMNDQKTFDTVDSVERENISYALPAVQDAQIGAHVDAERFRTLIQQYRTEADARLLGNAYEAHDSAQNSSKNESSTIETPVSDSERVSQSMVTVEKDGSVEKVLAAYIEKKRSQGDTFDRDSQAIAHLMAQQYEKDHAGIDLDHVHPGTVITIGQNVSADGRTDYTIENIDFPNGPHIVSDQEKVKHTITQYSSPAEEAQHIKTLLKDPMFNKKVAQQISDIFGVKNIGEIKTIAQKPLRSFFRVDNAIPEDTKQQRSALQERLSRVIENAQEIYGDAGMPRDHASVQNYFIRIYARAQQDGLVKDIFSL